MSVFFSTGTVLVSALISLGPPKNQVSSLSNGTQGLSLNTLLSLLSSDHTFRVLSLTHQFLFGFPFVPHTGMRPTKLCTPSPKEIKAETKTVPVEKNTDIPPTDFLQELHSHINPDPFHVYAAIGLPENDVFPTLSYPDYYTLVTPDKDQKKVLSWKSIFDCMLTKYLPLKNTVLPGKDFYDYLVNSGNNMDGTKSVLLYPGRWGGFRPSRSSG